MSGLERRMARIRVERSRKRSAGDDVDGASWFTAGYAKSSVTGIRVSQISALSSVPVIAATTMLSEDVAKLRWSLWRHAEDKSKTEAKDHWLYDLLHEPNPWMNGLEMREMMQGGMVMRGNAYALIQRDGRDRPVALIPWNPDQTHPWVGADGSIFYRFTSQNPHEMAILNGFPFLVPSRDVLHIRGFTMNGLLGLSRIAIASEAVALGMAQEQQAARWMGQGARPSGMMTTDQKLSPQAAERLNQDIKATISGLQNSGKIIVGEQGLKFLPFSMTSADLEFIASRQFQLQEVARLFRIPPHMLGELSRSTNNNIAQQAQEYINFTLTGYTNRWRAKMSSHFGLRGENLSVEFDFSDLTEADLTSRINNWRTMVMSMLAKPDEGRIDLGLKPEGGEAAKLHFPQNMASGGSQSTGTAPDDAGRPSEDDVKQLLADITALRSANDQINARIDRMAASIRKNGEA